MAISDVPFVKLRNSIESVLYAAESQGSKLKPKEVVLLTLATVVKWQEEGNTLTLSVITNIKNSIILPGSETILDASVTIKKS